MRHLVGFLYCTLRNRYLFAFTHHCETSLFRLISLSANYQFVSCSDGIFTEPSSSTLLTVTRQVRKPRRRIAQKREIRSPRPSDTTYTPTRNHRTKNLPNPVTPRLTAFHCSKPRVPSLNSFRHVDRNIQYVFPGSGTVNESTDETLATHSWLYSVCERREELMDFFEL